MYCEDALIKLASDLIDRVDTLEQENKVLKDTVDTLKTVKSDEESSDKSNVDLQEVDSTCNKLVDVGYIPETKIDITKQAFLCDPNAAYKTIRFIIDAQTNTKQASINKYDNISGGTLVEPINTKNSINDTYDLISRLQSILNI